jgi:hypothetical protein
LPNTSTSSKYISATFGVRFLKTRHHLLEKIRRATQPKWRPFKFKIT